MRTAILMRRQSGARAAALAIALASLAVICWVVATRRMAGMDMGPGADLGSFPFFAATWATMMAAMMLPSALPAVLSFDQAARDRGGTAALTLPAAFAASYLAVWIAVGVVVFAVDHAIRAAHVGLLAWDQGGPYVAGAAVAAAGVYELAPLKRACLRRCRASIDGIARSGVRPGLRYGIDCVGCCAGLMLVLFALGAMSVFWMAAVTLLVFVQKVPAVGARSRTPIALLLVGLGVWIALAPSSVPWLTPPM
jgi:predicted metal-binding membrane protein